MLIQYTHYPTGDDHKTQLKKNIIIDYFKGLLMTHHLDLFIKYNI